MKRPTGRKTRGWWASRLASLTTNQLIVILGTVAVPLLGTIAVPLFVAWLTMRPSAGPLVEIRQTIIIQVERTEEGVRRETRPLARKGDLSHD